jgi:hypothetical protein
MEVPENPDLQMVLAIYFPFEANRQIVKSNKKALCLRY